MKYIYNWQGQQPKGFKSLERSYLYNIPQVFVTQLDSSKYGNLKGQNQTIPNYLHMVLQNKCCHLFIKASTFSHQPMGYLQLPPSLPYQILLTAFTLTLRTSIASSLPLLLFSQLRSLRFSTTLKQYPSWSDPLPFQVHFLIDFQVYM